MKKRFLKRRIVRETCKLIKYIKKSQNCHDWFIREIQGRGIEQLKSRYAPYFIRLMDIKINSEAVSKVKQVKQAISMVELLELKSRQAIIGYDNINWKTE